jgi:uncharacterized C2H2 Zn-finger protein
MAKRQTTRSRKRSVKRRDGLFVCPRCGFEAAHAAGLGRHRSAIHGVVSKRQRARSGTVAGKAAGDAHLAQRVSELERRYDRLLRGLEQVLRRAKQKS